MYRVIVDDEELTTSETAEDAFQKLVDLYHSGKAYGLSYQVFGPNDERIEFPDYVIDELNK